MAAGTRRGSPSRQTGVARPGQSPPNTPRGPRGCRARDRSRGTAVLPADSAALFQARSRQRPGERWGSLFAEKPQITLATGPDRASAGGSLPDKPCCSQQPQGPAAHACSRRSALPGSQASLPEAGTRLAAPLLGPPGPREGHTNTLTYFQEERLKERASPGGMPDCGSWEVVGGRGGGLESLRGAPQMTS